ncbi:pyranose dehydrogenase [Mycena capillaripes]|nr:pyranose dehydrogenase [Mycena capillaripes]
MLLLTLITLFLLTVGGLCKLYEDVADLPGLHYDFVIVGGGTAGPVVANRLTENPKVSVLVLEAGVSNEGVLKSEVPFLLNQFLLDAAYSWNYTTTPLPGLNGRSIPYFRAFLLGGCSAHNGMVYTRGAAADFDRYASLTGDAATRNDFCDSEQWTAPADNHDTTGQFNPHVHGKNGPISVSLSGFAWTEFEKNVMQTTQELPDEFPFNMDVNSGQPLGVSWLQSTIGNGERSTAATGYLASKYIQRPNLNVLLHAQVSKLVDMTKKKKTGKPSFGGVQFKYGNSLFVARARKEIILSAGSVGSPQILMNSGIGDHTALSAHGIPTVLDLPSVGKNASDHPSVFLPQWTVNSTGTYDSIRQNATAFAEGLAEWTASRTGPFVDSGLGTHLGMFRVNTTSPAFAPYADPAAGPSAPHIEFIFTPGGFGASGNFMTIDVAVVSPVSRGSIALSSSDPFAPPLIDPGFLSSKWDYLALREGVAMAQRFASAPVWSGFLGAMIPDLTVLSEADLENLIRSATGPAFHMVGTAGMSARNAHYGVVDPDFLVKGVLGLSVIDASTVPIVPTAHTQAVTYAFAERGADLLKQRWGC